MLKFSKVISKELSRYFEIIEQEFDYFGDKKAEIYYVLKRKNEIVITGPSVYYHEAVKRFKEKHPIWYIEDGRVKSAKSTDMTIKEFLKNFKKRHRITIKEMGITKVKII